ncbi:hypothetical protein AMTRI_Chr04g189250 [Amborella trichopoda]
MRILSLSLNSKLGFSTRSNHLLLLTPHCALLFESFFVLALYFLVLETGLGWLHKKLWNLLMEASVVEIIIQQVAATFVLLHAI